jgi:hypothetical protein
MLRHARDAERDVQRANTSDFLLDVGKDEFCEPLRSVRDAIGANRQRRQIVSTASRRNSDTPQPRGNLNGNHLRSGNIAAIAVAHGSGQSREVGLSRTHARGKGNGRHNQAAICKSFQHASEKSTGCEPLQS